jgi:DNA invertase Pin-like site-specific DNA recombinase
MAKAEKLKKLARIILKYVRGVPVKQIAREENISKAWIYEKLRRLI